MIQQELDLGSFNLKVMKISIEVLKEKKIISHKAKEVKVFLSGE
jgi:hypothetical protein